MRRRTLVWTTIGIVVAAVVVVIVVLHVTSGTSSNAASSSVPPTSAGASTPTSQSVPVVIPKTSSTSSLSYLSDLKPSGGLGELVNPGPVKISGSIYPKSLSFYCNVGDPTAFPTYELKPNARRFQATIGLPPGSSSKFKAIVLLYGDGRKLGTVTVSVPKPKTMNVDVTGIHNLRLECFGSGNSYTGGEAINLGWGNARIAGGR